MEFPIVHIAEGDLRGRQQEDINGCNFLSFEGIPYGKPPIGDLRFKAPLPAEPWNGVKDALAEDLGNLCKQETFFKKENGYGRKWQLEGSEDCLNLNVYTKRLPNKNSSPKPVMVFIHGGGSVTGTTRLYGPGILMTEDIVLVSIHYRMGAFGFLTLDDPELGVTGNSTLKDQVLALKWIQKNITAFNGDKNNVTVFGHSGGAGCVSLLVLSPSTAGLLHKAIIMSGSAISCWVYGDRNSAKLLAAALGYSGTDQKQILKFLQDQPAERIYEGQLKVGDLIQPSSVRPFGFVVENKDSKDAFLTEEPIKLLKSGKFNNIPIMIGYTDMEVMISGGDGEGGEGHPYGIQCLHEDSMPPVFLGLEKTSEEFQAVANKIKKFYFGDNEPNLYSLPAVHLSSDSIIIRGLLKQTEYLWKHSEQPVYLYRVSTPMDFDEPFTSLKINGVPHGEELPYIFTRRMELKLLSCDKVLMRKRMVALFTNFAKYGKPVPTLNDVTDIEWKPVSDERLQYLDIGDHLSLRADPEKERMKFWDELFTSYPHASDY